MSEVNTAFPVKCEHTRLVEINQLVPHPQNCKNHDKDAVERQAAVMEYQGWRRPITVSNLSGRVTSGHKRLLAAKLKKATHVPVSFQDYDNEDQEIADLIADNALNEWEPTSRTAVNLVVPHLGPEFDINMLGLKDFTLDIGEKDAGCDEDETPETPPEPVVKRGELWILGEHRLLIDDCTVKENVERLMAGEKAEIVFTSPPYNLGRPFTNRSGIGGKRSLYGDDANDEMSDDDYLSLLKRFTDTWIHRSEYVFVNIQSLSKNRSTLIDWLANHRDQLVETLVWVKTNPPPTFHEKQVNSGFEYVFVFTGNENKSRQIHTAQFKKGTLSNVFTSGVNSGNEFSNQHGGTFPVEFAEHHVLNFSSDLVVDAFCGAGTTVIACEKTGRRCFGMEIDPHYGQVIIERYIKFTGRNDVYRLEANGHKTPWPEVAPKHSP